MPEATITIRVKGMTCDGCTTSLTRALKASQGVRNAAVSLAEQHATITYDPELTDEEKLRSAVHRAGFIPVAG